MAMRTPTATGPRRNPLDQRRRGDPSDLRKYAQMIERYRRRKDGEEGGEAVPVDPNRPNTLSGGAAAPLEYD